MKKTTNIIQFYKAFSNEQICQDYLKQIRWKGRPCCPRCGAFKVTRFKDSQIWKCNACVKQFSVRKGTIFEESRLPLQKWFLAVFLITSLKKGISSLQLGRYLGITQKSAWFMLQRIRYAIEAQPTIPETDVIEMDEAYIGKKASNQQVIVVGAVKRYSKEVIAKVIPRADTWNLLKFTEKVATERAVIMTDEWLGYNSLDQNGYSRQTVNHSKEYVDGLIHINGIEGFWSHLQRGINGIYHWVSEKHMQKYVSEYAYRFSTRGLSDFERFEDWMGLIVNVRLRYKELTK